MKPGDVVCLRGDRIVVQLLNDSLENKTSVRDRIVTELGEVIPFRRGDVATVIEINKKNIARVKVLYKSGVWWGNVFDMFVIE